MPRSTFDAEIESRYRRLREAMQQNNVDVLVVAGSEYTGFEGGVAYLSGFQIVHRYAYVLFPLEAEPTIVFPAEARYVGAHDDTWVEEKVFPEHPGEWMRARISERGWRRPAVYGLDYIMNVRDYRALATGSYELAGFDLPFDLARAVKSERELQAVRRSMAINEEGFWSTVAAYQPGRTAAAIMAPASARFTELGTGRHAMNMVLSGAHGSAFPEFRFPDDSGPVAADDLLLYSLEVAGPDGYWVEFSRPLIRGEPSDTTKRMMEAYREYSAIATRVMIDGATAAQVHHAVSEPFLRRGFRLGHVTGHSIGMTMIENPRIGAGVEVVLRENMVLSTHPHVISVEGDACLYMQDTYRVGRHSAENLSQVPIQFFKGGEQQRAARREAEPKAASAAGSS